MKPEEIESLIFSLIERIDELEEDGNAMPAYANPRQYNRVRKHLRTWEILKTNFKEETE